MIGRDLLSLTLFGVIALAICHGAELNSNEAEARKFLNHTSDELFSFYDEIGSRAFADSDENYSYDQREANRNYSIFLTKIVEDSRKFDFKNFKDEELKFAFEKLVKEADEKIIGGDRFLELFDSIEELDDIEQEESINDYHDSSTALAYSPDIDSILETSNDAEELKYYWSAWRKRTGEWANENLDITLEALRQAANLSELSPLEFWLRGFNISDMENMMTEIRPLYLELHAFVRDQLRKKFGESNIAPDGLIPDHLFRQITHQILTNDSIIEELFPYDELPRPEMEKFTAKRLHRIAEKLFIKLGFQKYPSSVWRNQIQSIESEDDDDECQYRIWYWTPTIHLDFCESMNFWDFLDAYSNMAHIYHAKEMVGLPAYFFDYPNRLDIGVSNAIVLSSSTHQNLKTIGLIPDYKFNEKVEMNRLLRMAIRQLMVLFGPLDFVHVKVMAGLLSGDVGKEELNKHYWQLMEKYVGVGPPKDHKSDTYDLPLNFYREMNNNEMSSDFTMEMLGYQIYAHLCELSGHYPKEPLHLCDISESQEAGDALKKMMRLGASKPFYKILASMFPENPKVTAKGLLEYYHPLKEWLVAKNKKANVKVGWKKPE